MDISILALQASTGFVTGALIGYALKRAAKFLMTIVGLWLMSLVGLAYAGIIAVNWDALNALLTKLITWLGVEMGNITSYATAAGVFGVSTVFGVLVGAGFMHSLSPCYRRRRFVRRRTEYQP